MILAGDIFDLWRKSPDQIRKEYKGTIELLRRLKARGTKIEYILGTHDALYLKDPIIPLAEIPVHPYIKKTLPCGKKIIIIHGHELDPMYLPGRIAAFFNFIGSVFGCRFGFKRTTVNDLIGQKYIDGVRAIHEKAQRKYNSYDYVIMGHTHAPLSSPKKEKLAGLYNVGDWKGHNSYVVIDGDKITIRYMMSDPPHEWRWFRLYED